ncbi:MAG: FMN-binding protein, partial [Proteobacteria bacterium]|nr:FMN-binding protein [Pseudomonadota bacterium]
AIVTVFSWANPLIQANQAARLAGAITEVLGGAERYETVFLDGGAFTNEPQADTANLDRVYVGYDAAGAPHGVAIVTEASGFADVVRVIFGYDPATGNLLGMTVLENKETPGLGDKIEKDSTFVGEFQDVGTPLQGVKKDRATGTHEEVVMITGATISSRTVVDMINRRLEAIREPVGALWASTSVAPEGATPDAARAGSTGGGL